MLNKKLITIAASLFFIFLLVLLTLLYINRPVSPLNNQMIDIETPAYKENAEVVPEISNTPERPNMPEEYSEFIEEFQEVAYPSDLDSIKANPENFCLDNFDFDYKTLTLTQKIEEKKSESVEAAALFDNYNVMSTIYAKGLMNCDGANNDICRKILSLNDLSTFVNSGDKKFCNNYENEADKDSICQFLGDIAKNKYIYLTEETKSQVCSVDDGFPGSMIFYNDNNSRNQQCISDGGQIFNIILATVNRDSSYCENIKDAGHNLHKLSCSLGALSGNSDLTAQNYKESFCKVFSDAIGG